MPHSWSAHGLVALACASLVVSDVHADALVTFAGSPAGVSAVAGVTLPPVPSPLSLEDALRFAREHHPELRIARASLGGARADSTFAGVHPFNPELEVHSVRGGESFGSSDEGSFEAGVRQELDLWGKRGQRRAVAGARSGAASAGVEARFQAIASAVRGMFQRTLFLQQRLELLTEFAELDRRVATSTEARVRDGAITPLTGRLIELDFLGAESQRMRARSDLRQSVYALGAALGGVVPETLRLSGTVAIDTLRLTGDDVVARALQNRREGDLLRRDVEVRRGELRLADLEGRPNLTIGIGVSREVTSFDGSNFSGDPAIVRGIGGARAVDHLWRASVSVPIPLWQRNQGARARATADIQVAQAEYEGLLSRIQLESFAAAARFRDAAELYHVFLDRTVRLRSDIALIREAYMDGRISLDSYLAEKSHLVDTLTAQLEAAEAYWEARAALETAVGEDLDRLNQGGIR